MLYRVLSKALTIVLACMLASCGDEGGGRTTENDIPKTTFQSGSAWMDRIDARPDAVMVYGVGPANGERSLEERLRSWRNRGYRTDFMTGIAWGSYQDYFSGQWDGVSHFDEGQMSVEGDTIWHGRSVPYIVPSRNYLEYLKETNIRRAIDAGVDAIYLEEPEFWARGGYSASFKKEWEDYYGTPWVPQDNSPEATYLSNKLKYHLYYRALQDAFTYAKEYGASLGRDIKCYVPTHSLINYSMWEIVSPEASLASLSCVDGYIAQVWTGTSRTPLFFEGEQAERVFEYAFLEYGCMASMTEPTHRKMWFLTDPIEDATRNWQDYDVNYKATFTAQLLYPQVSDYEVMPWPERVYTRPYPASPASQERVTIPRDYATLVDLMTGTLRSMPKVDAVLDGSHGISVLLANSLMFQRFPVHDSYDDPAMSNFFGLAMPLLKAGVPVGMSHIENLSYPETLDKVKVLLMTYSNCKPLDPTAHEYLAKWVERGGNLLYAGSDMDPFQGVKEWWNTFPNSYAAPSEHLFERLGLSACPSEGVYSCGKGKVMVLRTDPKAFVMEKGGQEALLSAVEQLYGPLQRKNSFCLDRGPYKVVAVLEDVPGGPLHLDGDFIDLYDPAMPVHHGLDVQPGSQKLLYDLAKRPKGAHILAEATRSYELSETRCSGGKAFSFLSKGPAQTTGRIVVSLPTVPASITIAGQRAEGEWDPISQTLQLSFDNNPDGVRVRICY